MSLLSTRVTRAANCNPRIPPNPRGVHTLLFLSLLLFFSFFLSSVVCLSWDRGSLALATPRSGHTLTMVPLKAAALDTGGERTKANTHTDRELIKKVVDALEANRSAAMMVSGDTRTAQSVTGGSMQQRF